MRLIRIRGAGQPHGSNIYSTSLLAQCIDESGRPEHEIAQVAISPQLRVPSVLRLTELSDCYFSLYGCMWIVAANAMEHKRRSRDVSMWPNSHITVSFWRALHFMRAGCDVVGVCDGPSAPIQKRRQRHCEGVFAQQSREVANLLHALGCPTIIAQDEAEGLCAKLSKEGLVDATASADSDVFPFGAQGLVLKEVSLASADSGWCMEVVDVMRVRSHLGLGQQGLICLANLAGCDFSAGAEE